MKEIINTLFSFLPERIRNIAYYRFLWSVYFPEIIHIENTNACNARCTICAREQMVRPIGFMELDLFKKIIDECSEHDIVAEVHLHGFGEPLLDPQLINKLQYAKQRNIKKTYFVTNASLLSVDTAEKLIASGLDKIKFSFYGADKETYEAIHCGLNFDEVENNIRNFFKIRDKMGSARPAVTIQFIPQAVDVEGRNNLFRKWKGFINKKYGDRIEDFYLHNWIYGRGYNSPQKKNRSFKSCAIPFKIIQILSNGDVVPCVFDFNGKMTMGQVRTKTIKQVWNSAEYVLLRKNHRLCDFVKIPLCATCDQLRKDL